MNRRLFSVFLAAVVAVALTTFAAASGDHTHQSDQDREHQRDRDRDREHQRDRDHNFQSDRELPERDEIRQTYELTSGARVEVSGINGSVEIETSNVRSAEVHIVRSANDRADLEFHKIIIEHTPDKLVVRGEKDRERRSLGRGREVRQRVMMKIPRQVDLLTSGVNGKVNIGAIDGPVQVSGVNGRVDVAQARGYSHLSGINGRVSITITELGERGIHVSGVNGGVDLQFAEELNADLNVSAVNGSVSTEVPNVTVQGKLDRNNFRARIGNGGSPISVSGVNGRVRLSRAGAAG
jgi:DUF4097 and DUF4098 domain-containing protein YvlB